MKTFGKMIALAFVLFNAACEPDDTITTSPILTFDDRKFVSVDANLIPETVYYGDGAMFLRWSGAASSNLAGKLNLSLSHFASETDENNTCEIQDGSFNLWSDDYQHTLVGTYTGYGQMTNGQFIMEGYITIQSGAGNFVCENGSLSFSIAPFIPFSGTATESEILIRGSLKVPDIAPVP